MKLFTQTKKTTTPPANARARANTLLLAAAKEGDAFGVRLALEKGADVNIRDARKRTPLLLAITAESDEEGPSPRNMPQLEKVYRRSVERAGENSDAIAPVVQMLLRAGSQVNVTDADGFSPLLRASALGNSKLCQELLRRKADVNFRNSAGLTALIVAIVKRDVDMVDLLIKAGANVKNDGRAIGMPLLGMVIYRPKTEKGEAESMGTMMGSLMGALLGPGGEDEISLLLVERLLRAGADPNETGQKGLTPLVLAAAQGSPRIVRHLLDRGARVDAPLSDGSTPLLIAAAEGRADNARVLMEAGANVQAANNHGDTPLIAATEKASYALVERLLVAGVNQGARNVAGQTARDLAVASKHTAIVHLFDAHAASPPPI